MILALHLLMAKIGHGQMLIQHLKVTAQQTRQEQIQELTDL